MARIVNLKYKNISFDDVKKRYYVTLYYGIDVNGKRKKQSKSFKTLQEAKICLKQFEADKTKEMIVMPTKETVADYMLYWVDSIKALSCEETTLYGYRKIIENHFIPKIGNRPLQEVTPQNLNTYFMYLKKERKLSNSTIKKHQDLLKSIFKSAVHEEKILKNPMDKIEKVKSEIKEVAIYNVEQLKILFEKVEGHPLEIPVKLSAYLGLRRGEINGLKWEHVDLEKGELVVRETRTAAGKTEIHKGVKTYHSKRRLALPDELKTLLEEVRSKQCESSKKGRPYEYVFCKADGTVYKANYCSNEFKKFLKRKGLPCIKFHALRHSCASVANAMGIPLFEISRMLGHGSTAITSKIYTHQFSKANSVAISKIAEAYKS